MHVLWVGALCSLADGATTRKTASPYSLPPSEPQIKKDDMGRPCSTNRDENAHKILIENPEGMRQLGRLGRR